MIRRLIWWKLAGLALVPFLALAVLLSLVATLLDDDHQQPTACGTSPAVAAPAVAPSPFLLAGVGSVAGYSGVQLQNAATIMRAGADVAVSVQGQTLGVAVAMAEANLTVLTVGDLAGPDSRGLFQQRANGAWGSEADRLDPYISATNFFLALVAVPGWESLAPTIAAHRVQGNADPNLYAKFWAPATQVVAALGGGITPAATSGAIACQDTAPLPGGALTAAGWTKPTVGPFTSGFGLRGGKPHNGVDIAPACGSPVVAAADGVVVLVVLDNGPPATGYGTLVAIDHGGGVITRYAHAFPEDVLVRVGDRVTAGQQISRVGTFGDSTGCHLHFEVLLGGSATAGFTDPVPFLRQRGIELAPVAG